MKTINLKTMILICVAMTAMLFAGGVPLCAASREDNADRLSSRQALSYGYNNAAIRNAEWKVRKALEDEGKDLKDEEEKMDKEMGQNMKGQQLNKPEPKLQMKSGQQDTSRPAAEAQVVSNLIDSTKYNVKIGSGTNKTYDGTGKLISEVIEGQRHVYVGFANAGKNTIVDGINQAKKEGGGIVIVKSGTYNESYINMVNGISLYGGYNELGERDVKRYTTTVNGYFSGYNITNRTELNGFTIKGSSYAITIAGNTQGWIILNNTMKATYMNISSSGNATIYNNDISGSGWAVHSWGSYYGPLKFINNIVHNTSWGFTDAYGSRSIVENNIFYNNQAAIISHTGATIIRNNTFTSTNGSGIGVRYFSSAPVVENNIFYNLATAFSVEYWAATGASGPSTFNLKDNVFYNNAAFGISAASLAKGLNIGSIFNVNPGIDPTRGIYMSILTGKGYSPAVVNTTYSKFQLGNAASKNLTNSGLDTKNMNTLRFNYYSPYATSAFMLSPNIKDVSTIVRQLILNKDMWGKGMAGRTGPVTVEKIVKDSMRQSALSIPNGRVDPQVMEMAMRLASIMKDPTADQELLIKSMSNFMNDMSKVEQETGQSPELTQAQDNLIQMMANVLLAQATSGGTLITREEMSYIMEIFKGLNAAKIEIMNDYKDATDIYYNLLKRDMLKNMGALQASGVLPKGMLENELENASRSKMQEIIDDLKKRSNNDFVEGYMRQREARYREKILDPNNKDLENKMRAMMNGFTGRLKDALEAKK